MTQRSKLIEKYFKSDIFNTSLPEINHNNTISNIPISLNNTFNSSNKSNDKLKPINQKKYVSKHHESDIFNINDIKKPNHNNKKIRNANKSTCFDGMKDNIKYANDLKEYTNHIRAKKVEYNPNKYFNNEDASSRLYNQLYDKNRNPILHSKNKSMMKSSTNLFSNIDIDNNNDNDINKTLFVEKRKKAGNEFIKLNFGIRNLTDKKNLEKELEKNMKNHKFYKTKGFTYNDNGGKASNNNNKYISIYDNYNNSKINKQLELQSNIFNNTDENIEINNSQKKENELNQIKQRLKLLENKGEKKQKKPLIVINPVINNAKNNKDINNNLTPFQRKMNQLADSNDIDIINDSVKLYNNNKNKVRCFTDLEQIDEILNDIPDSDLKYDKKKQLLNLANTTSLSGEEGVDKNILNYKNYHKVNINHKKNKEPIIKIMSKESQNHINNKINEAKNNNNLKKYDDYSIHDYIISYDTKNKNKKNNFDKFNENEIKLLFSKNGIHAYDITKNMFDNGKYNVIKFKVRENEGDKILEEKMKNIEKKLNEKEYKINIKKQEEKNLRKNLRNVAKAPWSKTTIFLDNIENKNHLKNKDINKNNKKSMDFSNKYVTINHNYKNHYKEQREKDKVK